MSHSCAANSVGIESSNPSTEIAMPAICLLKWRQMNLSSPNAFKPHVKPCLIRWTRKAKVGLRSISEISLNFHRPSAALSVGNCMLRFCTLHSASSTKLIASNEGCIGSLAMHIWNKKKEWIQLACSENHFVAGVGAASLLWVRLQEASGLLALWDPLVQRSDR